MGLLESISADPEGDDIEALTKEIERRNGQRLFYSMYPDTGPYARVKYQKHLEFFRAGAIYRERCFMAGNRIGKCLSFQTLIDTPTGRRTVGSLFEAALPFSVLSWDGMQVVPAVASAPFKKSGRHQCYRLYLRNGQWVECADHHRVLVDGAWWLVESLLSFGRVPLASTLGISLSVRGADDPPWIRTPSSSLAGYPGSPRSHGGQPAQAVGGGQSSLPSQGDAQAYTRPLSRMGGQADRCNDSPPARLVGAAHSAAARSSALSGQDACTLAEPSLHSRRESPPLGCAVGFASQLNPAASPLIEAAAPWKIWPYPIPMMSVKDIIAYEPIGGQDVYDFTVPRLHNYLAGGMVHHNTVGGGGYETTCHVTGEYPDWWEGRRWKRPVNWWAAGKTNETTRDIIQRKMLGKIIGKGGTNKTVDGTGLIPGELLGKPTWKQGVADFVDAIPVLHKPTGRWSTLGFKCHPATERVLMANGEWRGIDQVRLGELVRSPDGNARPVVQLHAYSDAPVLLIETRTGTIEATPNHPFFTAAGAEVLAGDLAIGDELSIAYHEPDDAAETDDWLVAATAVMIGDGCMRAGSPFFTCNEPPIVEALSAILPVDLSINRVGDTITYRVASSLHKRNRLTESLRADGLWGLKSLDKFIPAWVFTLPHRQRELFMRWLWTCDGSVTSKDATYSTSSPRLAPDVQRLLWTLDIQAPVKTTFTTNQFSGPDKKFKTFYVPLHGHERIKFLEIGKMNRDNECNIKPRPKGPRAEILSITEAGNKDVYCVGVEGVHELIVNGFRVGNSYQQGSGSFEGTEQDGIWLDEECPMDVYGECLVRTTGISSMPGSGGMIMLTFTPILGLTEVVLSFMPTEMKPGGDDFRTDLG